MKYNTRIAPSPTGDLHIGNVRTAYFNWLAARSTGGKFILRIDDTDQVRSDKKYVDNILSAMDWLKLDYDDIYYASKRGDVYKSAFDSMNDSNVKNIDGASMLNVDARDSWHDAISGTINTTDSDRDTLSKLVILKSDGNPSYHFASVVDDIDMDINFVIRGTDHIANTIKHIAIYDAFGKDLPKFAHVGLVHDGKKISKRTGGHSILDYKDKGYNPDALLNFVLRLGWGPTVDDKTTKIIDRSKALDMFLDKGKMRSPSSNIDMNKLDFLNKKYSNTAR